MVDLWHQEVLIGREPKSNCLLISVRGFMGKIGGPGSVPASVSRCLPAENRAHCKIIFGDGGAMTLVNLNEKNITCVNGTEIVSKRITGDSDVTLGWERYRLNVNTVVRTATLMAEKQSANSRGTASVRQEPPEYSIAPLRKVWEEYHDELFRITKQQKNINVIRGMYLPCTILSSLVGFAAKHIGLADNVASAISYFMYAVAAVMLFYGLYKTITDKSLEERERNQERFQERYVCPNPKCRHFMGNRDYRILRQDTNCPYCKCKFNEK